MTIFLNHINICLDSLYKCYDYISYDLKYFVNFNKYDYIKKKKYFSVLFYSLFYFFNFWDYISFEIVFQFL